MSYSNATLYKDPDNTGVAHSFPLKTACSRLRLALQVTHPTTSQRGYWLKLSPTPSSSSTLGGDAGSCDASACSGEQLTCRSM